MERETGKGQAAARRAGSAGFTLVEVLSAMVIFSIVVVAAYATFEFQHASFTTQNRVVEAQENLRAALDMMTRDIRLAGYGVPASVTLPAGMLPAGDNSIRNVVPRNRTTGPDDLYVLYAYDMDSNVPSAVLTSAMGAPAISIHVDNVTGFTQGDYIIVRNGTSSDLFQITGPPVAGTGELPHDASGVNATAYHAASLPYVAGDSVSRARLVRYFVDTVTDPAHPTLMLDKMTGAAAQPLADDIEDMQLSYGLDTDGDFVVDNVVVAPTATQIPQIRQIRLMLTARTRLEEKGWKEVRPAVSDHPAGTAPDGYRRRIIDVAIDLRNP